MVIFKRQGSPRISKTHNQHNRTFTTVKRPTNEHKTQSSTVTICNNVAIPLVSCPFIWEIGLVGEASEVKKNDLLNPAILLTYSMRQRSSVQCCVHSEHFCENKNGVQLEPLQNSLIKFEPMCTFIHERNNDFNVIQYHVSAHLPGLLNKFNTYFLTEEPAACYKCT